MGRDFLTVSDFCGTLASRLTLLVSVRSARGFAGGMATSRYSSREFDVDVDVGDGDDKGVDTDVSCVVTLPFVMLDGVV